jgi:hypothetical protein
VIVTNNIYLNNVSTLGVSENQDMGYRAAYSIPLFWLCMFSSEHLQHNDQIPFLAVDETKAIDNLSKRRAVIACLDPARLALYDQFYKRIVGATEPYWFMDMRQLVAVSGAEDLEMDLLRTFEALEDYTQALLTKNATSMQDHWFAHLLSEIKQKPEVYTHERLVGSSVDKSWPVPVHQGEVPKVSKNWWPFGRK